MRVPSLSQPAHVAGRHSVHANDARGVGCSRLRHTTVSARRFATVSSRFRALATSSGPLHVSAAWGCQLPRFRPSRLNQAVDWLCPRYLTLRCALEFRACQEFSLYVITASLLSRGSLPDRESRHLQSSDYPDGCVHFVDNRTTADRAEDQ